MQHPGEHEKASRQEVSDFLSLLSDYGLQLEDLVKNNPRSWQDRQRAQKIARYLGNDPQLMVYIKEHRSLPPVANLTADAGDKRLLERYFQYIIALALIISGNFPLLTAVLTTWTGSDT